MKPLTKMPDPQLGYSNAVTLSGQIDFETAEGSSWKQPVEMWGMGTLSEDHLEVKWPMPSHSSQFAKVLRSLFAGRRVVWTDYREHPLYENILQQVAEEEYPVRSETIENACKVADMVPESIRDELEAYPMYDGDVYVKARNDRGDHVTVICQDDGSVVHRFKLNNYREYLDGDMIDRGWVRMTFDALGPWGGAQRVRQ